MNSWIGKSIILIGCLHTIVGVVGFHDVFSAIAREGIFNTVGINHPMEREAAFWFMYTGFALLIIGGMIVWNDRNHVRIPNFLPWSFLAITIVGAVIMPVSGFWLLFIPTVGFLRRINQSNTSVPEPQSK